MRIISMAALSVVFSLFSSFVLADVYQWKDAQGRVHFGDTAPNNKSDVKILEKSPESNAEAGAADAASNPAESSPRYRSSSASRDHSRRVADELSMQRKQKAEERKRKLDEKAKLETECNTMKSEIAMRAKAHIYIKHNVKGGVQYISDPEREKEDTAFKQKYQEKCQKVIQLEEREKKNKVGDML